MSQIPNWLKLDNAGKIFPSTSSSQDTGVFRFTCELTEPVQEAPLQLALEQTLQQFPHFLYVLRRGLFWYYLEASDLAPRVHPENRGICAQLFYRNRRTLLFDVSFYDHRIHFEVYHVLTDGTGAISFFQFLICSYLAQLHPDLGTGLTDGLSHVPIDRRAEDSFRKYYKRVKGEKSKTPGSVYHLHGIYSEEYRVTEGLLSCREMIALAKEHHTTLTILLCAYLILSIHQEMPLYKEKKSIVITVPVNLRKYFPSDTVRNFFGSIRVSYRFGQGSDTLDDIIQSLSTAFERELTEERLSGKISSLMSVERNPFAKIVPLSLKNLCLRTARYISNLGETIVVSNIGKINMPEQVSPYLRHMSVFSSTAKLQLCICTCEDVLSVGFSSRFEDTEIQRNFFRMLTDLGIQVEIKSNIPD